MLIHLLYKLCAAFYRRIEPALLAMRDVYYFIVGVLAILLCIVAYIVLGALHLLGGKWGTDMRPITCCVPLKFYGFVWHNVAFGIMLKGKQ